MEKQRLALAAVLISTTVLVGLLYLLAASSSDVHSHALAASADAAPTVTAVVPSSITNDADNPVAISGDGFAAVLSGTAVITPPTIHLDSTSLGDASWVSTTTLTTTVPTGFPAGVYTVTVTNPDGQSGSLPDGLTVQNPVPVVRGLTPVSGTYGQITTLTITGTGFVATPTVSLGGVACLVQHVSSTTLTTTVPGDLPPGTYALAVRNPGPGSPQHVAPGAFTLYSPVPTVTSCEPRSAANDLDTLVVITGTNFAPTPTLTLNGTSLEQVSWISLTQLSALVPWGMNEGVYTLTVTNPNPGASPATLPNVFTVTQGIGVWNAGALYGGPVDEVTIDPNSPDTVYAIRHSIGLFRSQDGGQLWSFKYSAGAAVGGLAVDPVSSNWLYMYAPWTLYRSGDGGETWISLNLSFPGTQTGLHGCWSQVRPHVHPSQSGTIYASSCNFGGNGLLKSTDYGDTWVPVMNGLTDTLVTDLAFHPTDPMTMYVGTSNGNVFRSVDGGASWNFAARPLQYVKRLAVNPCGAHEVWAVSQWGAVASDPVKSTNAAATEWVTAAATEKGEGAYAIAFSPVASGTVYIAGGHLVYRTTDGGQTWESFMLEGGEAVQDVAMHPADPSVVYMASLVGGVLKSTDSGETWESVNHGLTAMIPVALAPVPSQPDVVYAVFDVGGVSVYRGTQGGKVWRPLPADDAVEDWDVSVDPFEPSRLYLAAFGKIGISDDGGQSWTYSTLEPPAQYITCEILPQVIRAHPMQPGFLLVGTRHVCGGEPVDDPGCIYRSTDHGVSWTRATVDGERGIRAVIALAFDPVSTSVAYASTPGSGMLRSTDSGQTWHAIGTEHPDMLDMRSITVEPKPPYRVFAFGFTGGDFGPYVSQDQGESWSELPWSPGLGHNIRQALFAPGTPPVLYVASDSGLRRSTDGGLSWQRAAGSLGYVNVRSLAVAETEDRIIIYAGTTGGQVLGDLVQALDLSIDDHTLLDPGVYRYTTRQLTERTYLPVVLRAYVE